MTLINHDWSIIFVFVISEFIPYIISKLNKSRFNFKKFAYHKLGNNLSLSLNTFTYIITYTLFVKLITHTLSDSGESSLTYLPQNGLVTCRCLLFFSVPSFFFYLILNIFTFVFDVFGHLMLFYKDKKNQNRSFLLKTRKKPKYVHMLYWKAMMLRPLFLIDFFDHGYIQQ